jgi:hypothetical protein
MSCYVSLHANHSGPARVGARAVATKGAPLILEVYEASGVCVGEITIFVGDEQLADRLAAAINGARVARDLGKAACVAAEAHRKSTVW